MMDLHRVGGLEIQENLADERRGWHIQRVAWVCLALVLLAAVLGLFGDGPLSMQVRQSEDGRLDCQYQRFVRMAAPARLRINVTPDPTARDVRLTLNEAYLVAMRVEAIRPEPLRSEADKGGVTYVFGRRAGSGPMRVVLNVIPDDPGRVPVRLQVAGVGELTFWQFVYP